MRNRALFPGQTITTGSMERAMNETNRRRDKQVAFNEKHGLVPQALNKKVPDEVCKYFQLTMKKSMHIILERALLVVLRFLILTLFSIFSNVK